MKFAEWLDTLPRWTFAVIVIAGIAAVLTFGSWLDKRAYADCMERFDDAQWCAQSDQEVHAQ